MLPVKKHSIQDWLFALVLLIATVLAYQPAWTGQPIWDDDAYLTKPSLRSWTGLAHIWFKPGTTAQYYPLVYGSFWVEHKLWGDATLGYHLVNILLHVIAALLLMKILQTLQVRTAWLAAAIFALHPVQVETVAWMTELKNTLSGVFYFGAALAYLRFDRTRNKTAYAVGLGFFLLGLMSKTVIATLPAALLVVFWWKRGKLSWKQHVMPLLPFFGVGIVFGVLSSWMERHYVGAEGVEYNYSLVERVLIAGRAVWFYLGKLLWPADLVFSYPHWHISQTVRWQYLFPAAAALTLVGLWRVRSWNRGPLAAMLFFGGTLFPALGFLNVFPFRYSFVADHFQYLACVGPIVLAVAGIELALDRTGWMRPLLRPPFLAALLITLGTLTWRQSRMYTDVETLWETTLERNPDSWLAHNNLGTMLLGTGDFDEAMTHFQKALEIDPYSSRTHHNVGLLYARKGQLDDAIAEYKKAIALDPGMTIARVNLGAVLMQKGELDEAIEQFQKALAGQPDFPGAHNDLAIAFAKKGLLPEAIAEFQTALETDPENADTHKNLGLAYMQQGETKKAIEQFQKARQINPNNVEACDRLAWLLATAPDATLRDGATAVSLSQHAGELAGPDNPIILRTLAAAYAETGDFTNAETAAQHALDIIVKQKDDSLAGPLRAEIKLYHARTPAREDPTSH